MTDDSDFRWGLLDPVLPLACALFAGGQLIALDPDIEEKLVGIAFPQGPPDTVPKLVESLRKTICD